LVRPQYEVKALFLPSSSKSFHIHAGKAIAKKYVELDADVIVNGRNKDTVKAVAEEFRKLVPDRQLNNTIAHSYL